MKGFMTEKILSGLLSRRVVGRRLTGQHRAALFGDGAGPDAARQPLLLDHAILG